MLRHIKCETNIGRGFKWKKTVSMIPYKGWEYLYNELYILVTKREVSRHILMFLQISEITCSKIIVFYFFKFVV